jgi:hypothetical protein
VDLNNREGTARIMGLALVLTIVICLSLALLVAYIGTSTLGSATKLGLLTGLGICFAPYLMNSLFARVPVGVVVMDAGYHVIGCLISCIVLSLV